MKTKRKAVIFDFGGVLSYPQNIEIRYNFANLLQMPFEKFQGRYLKYRYDYDQGLINTEEYWCRITGTNNNLGKSTLTNLFLTDYKSWLIINQAMLDWSKKLQKNNIVTAILSNMPMEYTVMMRKDFLWLENFHPIIFSSECKLIKPDRRIFDHILQCLKLNPEDCYFIDDNESNINMAKSIGFQTFRFQWHKNVIQELEGCLNFDFLL